MLPITQSPLPFQTCCPVEHMLQTGVLSIYSETKIGNIFSFDLFIRSLTADKQERELEPSPAHVHLHACRNADCFEIPLELPPTTCRSGLHACKLCTQALLHFLVLKIPLSPPGHQVNENTVGPSSLNHQDHSHSRLDGWGGALIQEIFEM